MSSTGQPRARNFLNGGGEIAALILAHDWSRPSSLGPPAAWPAALKTAMRIMLTSRQAMWIGWGSDLICLYNDACRAIIGGKHPAALGQPAALVWREIWGDIAPLLATAMRGDEGTYAEAQLLIMERNGYQEETYYTFSYSPIADDDGSVGGIICVNIDETERVVRERQLKLLRQLAAASAEARTVAAACELAGRALSADPHDLPFALIYLLDTSTNQLGLAATTGIAAGLPATPPTIGADVAAPWPVGTVLRTHAAEVVALSHLQAGTLPHGPWDRPPREALVVPIAGRGQRSVFGLLVVGLNPYRLLDDAYREFIALIAAPISTNLANLANLAGATALEGGRDLIGRVDAQLGGARQQEGPRQPTVQIESVINNAPLGIYLVDQDFKIAQANPIAVPVFGDIPDLIGRDFSEVIHRMWTPQYADEIVRLFRHTLLTGECHVIHERAEFRIDRGTTEYYDWRIDRIPLADRRHGVVCYFRDVSDQVNAGAAMAESEARFRELADDLGEANRLKDEFLATLSHELRTPLNAMLGWLHMLRAGTVTAAVQQRALESMERNARTQARLVEDLLDVSRIVSGKLSLKADAVDPAAVIAAAVETIRPAAFAKRVDLHVAIAHDWQVVVSGDPDRLQQVVWNLLSNAVKFTPLGGRIDIELRRTDTQAEIVVSDSGPGIEPQFLPHVFERFRQADSTPARSHGGLGLGLAIVRHLTEAHGGSVAAESDGLDQGATFFVRLPLREIVTSESTFSSRKLNNLAASFVGTRALVVDDEPDARDLLRYMLETQGAKVTAVGSAGAAIYTFARQRFDVLIADIGMPERDGYSLIRAIRGLPESRGGGVPAIAVTAYASRRDREQAFAAGYDYHLSKPVEPEELVTTVADAVTVADAIDTGEFGHGAPSPRQPRPRQRAKSSRRKS